MNHPAIKSVSFTPVSTASDPITVHIHQGQLCCPRCGATEVKDNTLPIDQWVWQIKAFRVDDWSKCLVCADAGIKECWFNLKGELAA